MIRLKEHVGVVLEPSDDGFDKAASTFCCVSKDDNDKKFYIYYTGSTGVKWSEKYSRVSIGLAFSRDGLNFVKHSGNPLFSIGKTTLTPAVFTSKGKYWMVFAFEIDCFSGRRLGIATSDSPFGPWSFLRQIGSPQYRWEGHDIDAGPSIVRLEEDEFIVFYSNVSNKFFLWGLSSLLGFRYLRRQIGLMKLKISGSRNVEVAKYNNNPLKLNGSKGGWNESLFCPGYFHLGNKHYLMPTTSTYSIGYPYKQYIGLFEDSSPFFPHPKFKQILINGFKEKTKLLPNVRGELALDTPSPLKKEEELWVYYAIMDRADGIWKTALSIFSLA